MRKASAPMLFLVGLLVLAAVAGITFGVATVAGLDDDADDATAGAADVPTPTSGPALGASQVAVTGIATAIAIVGGVLPEDVLLPIVTTPSAGLRSGARFEAVLVDGEEATLSWDAGRPLAMAPDTPLRLRAGTPIGLQANATGIAITFDDDVAYPIVPGDYRIDAPVAVTTSGLGSPQDSVTFTAVDTSTVAFTGQAGGTIPYGPLSALGPGIVSIEGTLEIRHPDGTVQSATSIVLAGGSFRVAATPTADGTGFDLTDVLLEGTVTVV